jgi:putative transposase
MALLTPLFPSQNRWPSRFVEPTLLLNGIFYLLRSGCTWRMMPREYPPWQTLYRYFRAWQASGVWEKINARLRER